MENGGGECRIGVAGGEDLEDVIGIARAAASDDGDMNRVADGTGHLDIVAFECAVGIHDVKDNFASAAVLSFFSPGENLFAGADAAAIDEDFPEFGAIGAADAIGIEAKDGGAAAEAAGNLGD